MHIKDFKAGHIHFVGIGGISMSGLALILYKNGYKVSGSDINDGSQITKLRENGIKTFIGHKKENVIGSDLVIYTASIKEENPEIIFARENNIPLMDRGTLLGQIMDSYSNSIGISGTHGKTTTTSMIATIFELADYNPTIHIGGVLPLICGSVKCGGNNYFITEADEYVESFLKLSPTCVVILNIDMDHPDYFRDLSHVESAFRKFADKLPKDGVAFGLGDDPNVLEIIKTHNHITFGFGDNNDWIAKTINFNNASGYGEFDAYKKGEFISHVKLSVPGEHNCLHALAALAVSDYYGIDPKAAAAYLTQFYGADRRFQHKGIVNGAKLIHDYAHHPAEIIATLQTAQCLPHNKIWCVYQPHTYSRTKSLFDYFLNAFDFADNLILTDIYAAREVNDGSINSELLANALKEKGKDVVYESDLNKISEFLKSNVKSGDIVLTMGAGNINNLDELLLKN